MDRLESLLNRFEGGSSRAVPRELVEEIKEVAKEAEVLSPVRAERLPDIVRAFDKEVIGNLAKWKQLAEETKQPHIVLVTAAASEVFTLTRAVVYALAISKKIEAKDIAQAIQKQLADSLNKSKDLINKDVKLKNHAKCVSDGLGLL